MDGHRLRKIEIEAIRSQSSPSHRNRLAATILGKQKNRSTKQSDDLSAKFGTCSSAFKSKGISHKRILDLRYIALRRAQNLDSQESSIDWDEIFQSLKSVKLKMFTMQLLKTCIISLRMTSSSTIASSKMQTSSSSSCGVSITILMTNPARLR